MEITGVGIHMRLMEELKLSENEADSYMRDIAIDAIKARPFTWLRLVFDDFRLLWMGIPDELEYHWKLWETRNWPRRLSHLIGPASAEQEAGFALTDRLVNIYQGPRLGLLIPGLFVVGLLACAFTPAWRPGSARPHRLEFLLRLRGHRGVRPTLSPPHGSDDARRGGGGGDYSVSVDGRCSRSSS